MKHSRYSMHIAINPDKSNESTSLFSEIAIAIYGYINYHGMSHGTTSIQILNNCELVMIISVSWYLDGKSIEIFGESVVIKVLIVLS